MAPGHELAPRGHAGERPDPMIVESEARTGEAIQVGRLHPRVAVTSEVIHPQGIEDKKEGSHGVHGL